MEQIKKIFSNSNDNIAESSAGSSTETIFIESMNRMNDDQLISFINH